MRFDDYTARHLDIQEHAERTKFAQSESNIQPADARHLETALDTEEQDTLLHLRGAVKGTYHLAVGVEFEYAADKPGVDRPAEEAALDAYAEGCDVDDRELALQQQLGRYLQALDGARELQAGHARHAGDARRQRQDEVRRICLEVRPFDADLVDLDRQE